MKKIVKRPAMTLIELMVVVSIIAVVMSLTLVSLNAVKKTAFRTQAIMDCAQLSLAVAMTKDVNQARYLPSYINIKSQYDLTQPQDAFDFGQLAQFYGPRFGTTPNPLTPNIKASGLPNWGIIQGSQCLVLFLGGYDGTNFTVGNQNTTTPFAAAGSRSTFFDFPVRRLWLPPNSNVPCFVDPFPLNGGSPGMPYVYMTAVNGNDYDSWNQYNSKGVCVVASGTYTNYADPQLTYTIAGSTVMPLKDITGNFTNMANWQIISAGPDSTFGPGGKWNPGVPPYIPGLPGGDDYANFCSGRLGDPK